MRIFWPRYLEHAARLVVGRGGGSPAFVDPQTCKKPEPKALLLIDGQPHITESFLALWSELPCKTGSFCKYLTVSCSRTNSSNSHSPRIGLQKRARPRDRCSQPEGPKSLESPRPEGCLVHRSMCIIYRLWSLCRLPIAAVQRAGPTGIHMESPA